MGHQGTRFSSFLVRITVGLSFSLHGWPMVAQLFRNHRSGIVGQMYDLNLEPALPMAIAVAVAHAFTGTVLLLGLFHKVASVLAIVLMVGAIWFVTGREGYFGGYEYNLAIIAMAVSIYLTGPGAYAYKLQRNDG